MFAYLDLVTNQMRWSGLVRCSVLAADEGGLQNMPERRRGASARCSSFAPTPFVGVLRSGSLVGPRIAEGSRAVTPACRHACHGEGRAADCLRGRHLAAAACREAVACFVPEQPSPFAAPHGTAVSLDVVLLGLAKLRAKLGSANQPAPDALAARVALARVRAETRVPPPEARQHTGRWAVGGGGVRNI